MKKFTFEFYIDDNVPAQISFESESVKKAEETIRNIMPDWCFDDGLTLVEEKDTRDWFWCISGSEQKCVEVYDELLGRPVRDITEYREIDNQVMEDIRYWNEAHWNDAPDLKRAIFFAAYPELRKYTAEAMAAQED